MFLSYHVFSLSVSFQFLYISFLAFLKRYRFLFVSTYRTLCVTKKISFIKYFMFPLQHTQFLLASVMIDSTKYHLVMYKLLNYNRIIWIRKIFQTCHPNLQQIKGLIFPALIVVLILLNINVSHHLRYLRKLHKLVGIFT